MSRSTDAKPWHGHFETVGSICAIVVGLAALYVSWDQGRVMRQEVAASVWPALQVDGFVTRGVGGLSIGLRVENAGVGPARVERLMISYEDEVVPDLPGLLERLPPGGDLSIQAVNGRIVGAGKEVLPFALDYGEALGDDAITVLAELSAVWTVEVCYCSVLNQCWISGLDAVPPVEVTGCNGPNTSLQPVFNSPHAAPPATENEAAPTPVS